jgi:hypothetical protein
MITGNLTIPLVIAMVLRAAHTPATSQVDVTFNVRVCEGSKFELVGESELESRESDCKIPLSNVPIGLESGSTKAEENTDGSGSATVGPIVVSPLDPLRLTMGCTTHNCMTLRLKGLAAGDVHSGMNRILVFAVRKSEAAAGKQ